MSDGIDLMTMRALQLTSDGSLEIHRVPIPLLESDEVLVKIAGAGLCHSDLAFRAAFKWLELPVTLGHESAGHVAAVGTDVAGFAEGEPVLVRLVWACGKCRTCLDGRDNVCIAAGGRAGRPPCPGLGPAGGMADFIKAKAHYLEPLGTLDPATAGPLADAGLTSMHAINGARHRLGDGSTVVVIGIGGLGHVGLQILKATTTATIVAVDSRDAKLDLARRLGADHLVRSGPLAVGEILDITDGYGADAIFDFVGVQSSVELAIDAISPDGALRLVGLGGGSFPYAGPLPARIPWGVDLRRSYAGTRSDQQQVIELAQAGRLNLECSTYPLTEAVQAFADLERGQVAGRAVLIP